LTLNEAGQDITLNLDMSGASGEPGDLGAGYQGNGTLAIRDGNTVASKYGYIGYKKGSTGKATIEGTGSNWNNSSILYIGHRGNGTLNIKDGGAVSNKYHGRLGYYADATGEVVVTGEGSTWTNDGDLTVGWLGSGEITILDGGLVSVAKTLTIDCYTDGDSFINMTSGGMLALYGKGDGSIAEYLAMIEGTGEMRYWNTAQEEWNNILDATQGQDYTLSYLNEGDLAGYTMLTVMAVPEPSIAALLIMGATGLLAYPRRKRK